MCIRNRALSLIYKVLLLALCGTGLLLNAGFPQANLRVFLSTFRYLTPQAMLLCCLYYFAAVIHAWVQLANKGIRGVSVLSPQFKGGLLMCLLLMMFAYQFMLADTPFALTGYGARPSNLLVHFVVPLLVFLDWLLFDRKGWFTAGEPFTWLLFPAMHYLGSVVLALAGSTYQGGASFPYPFLDPAEMGWTQLFTNLGFIALGFVVASYLLFTADRLMGIIYGKHREAVRYNQQYGGKPRPARKKKMVAKLAVAGVAPPPAPALKAPPAPSVEAATQESLHNAKTDNTVQSTAPPPQAECAPQKPAPAAGAEGAQTEELPQASGEVALQKEGAAVETVPQGQQAEPAAEAENLPENFQEEAHAPDNTEEETT